MQITAAINASHSFLRSPGLAIPILFPGTELTLDPTLDISHLSLSDAERANLMDMMADSDPESSKPLPVEVTRKSHLRFPPANSGLKIPTSLVLVVDGTLPKVFLPSLKKKEGGG